jgi:hypothetical protein
MSDTSRIGSSLPANLTVAPESATTNEDLFSNTHLQSQTPGLSCSFALTYENCLPELMTFSNSDLETVASAV